MRLMPALCAAALLLTLVVITASAYIRLAQIDAGCARATPCSDRTPSPSVSATVSQAQAVHRVAASAVGLLVLAIAALAWRRRVAAEILKAAAVAVLLTLFLAALGREASRLSSAVVLGNVSGGMALAGVLAWVGTRMRTNVVGAACAPLSRWPMVTSALLMSTIALGVLPGARVMHVLAALLTTLALGARSMHGPSGQRGWTITLAVLATLQLGLGPALASGHFPVALGIAHNAAAAGLVVGLAGLLAHGGRE